MTERMQRFCDLYLSNGRNITKAYKDAGYTVSNDNVAAVNGRRLLRNDQIRDYLSNHVEMLKAKAEHEHRLLTAEEVCAELCKIATGGDPDARAGDRIHALELYGKTLNLFNTTNVNVNASPIVIVDDLDE